MSDAASWVNVVVSVLALGVSVFAVWIGRIAHRDAMSVQRQIAEIEAQREQDRQLSALKASLHPQLRETNTSAYRLYVMNTGNAAAQNVRVSLNDVPLREHCAAVQNDDMPTHIGPNSEVSCLLAIKLGCTPPFKIEIRWDDDSGADRIYRGQLTF